MTSHSSTAIPDGSLIIVTGATSYVASYVIKGLLERGYRVRGVVRNISKATWLLEEVFPSFVQRGFFDLVEVPDLTAPNVLDTVIINSGASAIMHIATPFSFSPNPREVIPPAVEALMSLLRAASREPSVKRFVYTSSIGAAYSPKGNIPVTLTKNSWNDAALKAAWAPPPYEAQRGPYVYAASKIEAERAMFKFVEEEKPGFSVNTVNPFLVIGPALHDHYLRSTASWVRNVYNGEPGQFAIIPPACYIHVKDVAVLHIAAALDPDTRGERLLAWAGPFNMNMVLPVLRRQCPGRKFIEDGPSQPLCLATFDNENRLVELLRKWGGRDGWITLEETVRDGIGFDL